MKILAVLLFGTAAAISSPQILASDNAANPDYNAGLATGLNGGMGFAPWTVNETAGGDVFVGSSNVNGTGGGPGIDTAGRSWGLMAPQTEFGQAVILRRFANSYLAEPGNIFSAHVDMARPASGGKSYFGMLGPTLPGNNPECAWLVAYASLSHYFFEDTFGTVNTFIPISDGGIRYELSIYTQTEYRISITSLATGQNWSQDITGAVSGATRYRGFTANTRFSGSDPANHVFVNSVELRVTAVPEPFTASALALGLLVHLRRRGRKH